MNFKIKVFLFLIIALWFSGIFIEFLIPEFNSLSYIYIFVERIYSTVCHQQPEKLITFFGHKTMVCARCTGIYTSGFLVSFLLLFKKEIFSPKRFLIIYASLPMFIDILLYKSGVYHYSKIIGFTTGLVFGSVGITYIYNGLQILLEKNGKF